MQSLSKLNAARRKGESAGFSIAELMVVILIIGLLATQVLPRVLERFGDAKKGKAKADLAAIHGAVTQFAINNGGREPDSLELLVQNDANNNRYLEQTVVPKDPWGNEYYYQPRSGGQERQLLTYGADGSPGGEGEDTDMTIQQVLNGEL
ncbi:MAG: general secretion pathway protein G [Planctomycetota bacterium]|jgi:general secretion pathway protein G